MIATLRQWFDQFQVNSDQAFDSLVRGRIPLGAASQGGLADILRLMFSPGDESLDSTFSKWLTAHLLSPTVSTISPERWSLILIEVFRAISEMELPRTNSQLRDRFDQIREKLKPLYFGEDRDAEGAFLIALTNAQTDLQFLPFWRKLILKEEYLDRSYAHIGILGLRRAPDVDGMPAADVPEVLLSSLLELADKSWMDQNSWIELVSVQFEAYRRSDTYWLYQFGSLLPAPPKASRAREWLSKLLPGMVQWHALHATDNRQERIADLVDLGKRRGYLTNWDLSETLPQSMASQRTFEAVTTFLDTLSIEVIDADRMQVAHHSRDRAHRAEGTPSLHDPVQAYIEQTDSRPQLTPEEDVELAKRIRDCEAMIQKWINSFGFVVDEYLKVAHDLIVGRVQLDRVVSRQVDPPRYVAGLKLLIEKVRASNHKVETAYSQCVLTENRESRMKAEVKFEKANRQLQMLLFRFHFLPSVLEGFIPACEERHRHLLEMDRKLTDLKQANLKDVNDDSKLSAAILSLEVDRLIFERAVRMPLDRYHNHYRELFKWLRAKHSLRAQMVDGHLGLVVSVAKDYQNGSDLSLIDLIQEGNMGLMKAIDNYNYRWPHQFSFYARWWIRQAINRRVMEGKGFVSRAKTRPRRLKRSTVHQQGRLRSNSDTELTIGHLAKTIRMPVGRIRRAIGLRGSATSLSPDDLDIMFADFPGEKIQEQTAVSILRDDIRGAIEILSSEERRILESRFGIINRRGKGISNVSKLSSTSTALRTRKAIQQVRSFLRERVVHWA